MSNGKPSFQEIWNRIMACEGDEFSTKTGLPFTYEVIGDVFRSSRTDYNITRRNFETAYELVPFEGPGEVNNLIRGPAYVWAVLHDRRIRKNDW